MLDRAHAARLLNVLVWRAEARSKMRAWRRTRSSGGPGLADLAKRARRTESGGSSGYSAVGHRRDGSRSWTASRSGTGSHQSGAVSQVSQTHSTPAAHQNYADAASASKGEPSESTSGGIVTHERAGSHDQINKQNSLVSSSFAAVATAREKRFSLREGIVSVSVGSDGPMCADEERSLRSNFRVNTTQHLRHLIQTFLESLDTNHNGRIRKYDFMLWVTSALSDPVAMLESRSPRDDQQEPAVTPSRRILSRNRPVRRFFPVHNAELTRGDAKHEPSTVSRSILAGAVSSASLSVEDASWLQQKCLFEVCPVRVETPYGPGYIKDGESTLGSLKVLFHWGPGAGARPPATQKPSAVAYFARDFWGGFPDIKPRFESQTALAPVSSGRRVRPSADDLDAELRLYRKIMQENLAPVDIRSMTERQMDLFLPILLQTPSLCVKERILGSLFLLRRSFWLLGCMPTTFHASYGKAIITSAPLAQKRATAAFFRSDFQVNDVYGEDEPLAILCPLYPERVVTRARVERKFVSGHGPALLGLKLHGFPTLDAKVIYKPDEIRSDMMVMRMFEVFNNLWLAAELKQMPYAYTYGIVALSESSGVMEFIENACELQEWDTQVIAAMDDDTCDEFIRSAAGSYVACYIMGCRDRHKSNFMIKEDRIFLQIDFKHCFDRQTRGVDAPHFSVKHSMKRALKTRNRWRLFKELCTDAYRVLRRDCHLIIRICLRMFNGLWFSKAEMETWLLKAFRSSEPEDKALLSIPQMIDQGVFSIQRKLKSWTHNKSLARHRRRASRLSANAAQLKKAIGQTPGSTPSSRSAGSRDVRRGSSRHSRTKSLLFGFRTPSKSPRRHGKAVDGDESVGGAETPTGRAEGRTGKSPKYGSVRGRRARKGHARRFSDFIKDTFRGVFQKSSSVFGSKSGGDNAKSQVAPNATAAGPTQRDQHTTPVLRASPASTTHTSSSPHTTVRTSTSNETPKSARTMPTGLITAQICSGRAPVQPAERSTSQSVDPRPSTDSKTAARGSLSVETPVGDAQMDGHSRKPSAASQTSAPSTSSSGATGLHRSGLDAPYPPHKTLPRGFANVLHNRPSLDYSSDSDLEWAEEERRSRRQHPGPLYASHLRLDINTADLSDEDEPLDDGPDGDEKTARPGSAQAATYTPSASPDPRDLPNPPPIPALTVESPSSGLDAKAVTTVKARPGTDTATLGAARRPRRSDSGNHNDAWSTAKEYGSSRTSLAPMVSPETPARSDAVGRGASPTAPQRSATAVTGGTPATSPDTPGPPGASAVWAGKTYIVAN